MIKDEKKNSKKYQYRYYDISKLAQSYQVLKLFCIYILWAFVLVAFLGFVLKDCVVEDSEPDIHGFQLLLQLHQ